MRIVRRVGRQTAGTAGGFTLIELMITIVVAAVLIGLSARLYTDVREKSIVRGAVGNLAAFGQRAKLEAAKRNDFVTVSVRGSGSAWCIGLQTTTVGCDCLSATCDIDQVKTNALNGARLTVASFVGGSVSTPGGSTAVTTDFTIDPKLGMLRGLGAGGTVTVMSPSTKYDYRVRFNLSATGEMRLCVPTGGAHTLTDYPSCSALL